MTDIDNSHYPTILFFTQHSSYRQYRSNTEAGKVAWISEKVYANKGTETYQMIPTKIFRTIFVIIVCWLLVDEMNQTFLLLTKSRRNYP